MNRGTLPKAVKVSREEELLRNAIQLFSRGGKRDLRLKRGERLYHELITEVVVEGQRLGEIRPGDPHLATRLAMGTANSLLRWFTPAGTISAAELMSATVEYMLAGLAP